VPIFGDDGALRDEKTIRVTDMAFDEDVLMDQDRFLTAVLARPEFQRKMTAPSCGTAWARCTRAGTAERRGGRPAGDLPAAGDFLCSSAAPGDGSVFLNSMKLWAMREAGLIPEYGVRSGPACRKFSNPAPTIAGAHVRQSRTRAGDGDPGGRVPRITTCSRSRRLGQILGMADVRDIAYDVQIVTSAVTDGSLSSCPPAKR